MQKSGIFNAPAVEVSMHGVGVRKSVVLALLSLLISNSSVLAKTGQLKESRDVFDSQAKLRLSEADSPTDPSQIEGDTLELVKLLGIGEDIAKLRQIYESDDRNDKLEAVILRVKIGKVIQYAGFELEECLANIDGDLASTNMQFSFFNSRHEKAVIGRNLATFISSGVTGILDSAISIHYPPPTANIFGITGNSLAVAIPLMSLVSPKYRNPHSGERTGNMLAPIFGEKYEGSGYDRIIWEYINKKPVRSKDNLTRRQALLKTWESYRGLGDKADMRLIEELTGKSTHDKKISLDLLKTRSELLVELRALVQGMYKDISDLNTALLKL